LETGGQIGIANFAEDFDDLLLDEIGGFHFALGGHAGIYVTGSSELETPLI
jgi:hypothetical protein